MRYALAIILLTALVLVTFFLNIWFGSVRIPAAEVLNALLGSEVERNSWRVIILESRLPAALTALLAGSALSVAGLQMQTLFRNPVAGPYILGISSGASLGVAVLVLLSGSLGVQVLGGGSNLGNWALIVASGLGSVVVFAAMIYFSYKVKDITVLLIIGLMIGSVTSAIISVLQLYAQQEGLQSYVFWTFGSFRNVTMDQVYILLPILLSGLAITVLLMKPLNALLLGEYYAVSLGLNIRSIRIWIVIGTCVLAASITAFCGPIAFVGLAVPHLVRWGLNTSDHVRMVPACLLLGAALTGICNLAAGVPGSDYTLPINAVTSLVGAPVVIWVIAGRKRGGQEFK